MVAELVIVWVLAFGSLGWWIGMKKGQPVGGVIVCVFFGPLGVLLCAVSNSNEKGRARQVAKKGLKICPHCGKAVHSSVAQCLQCGAPFPGFQAAPVALPVNTPPPGWWIASDGRYYPPEQHPNYRPPTTGVTGGSS